MQGWWACHLSFEINSVRVLNTGTFILIFASQAFIKSGSYIHTYVCVLTEQMDMDKSTRLEILIENIHTLWDLPRLIKILRVYKSNYFLTIHRFMGISIKLIIHIYLKKGLDVS